MRIFRYHTLSDDDITPKTITLTEKEILDDYYGRWSERMRSRNMDDIISEENCIKEFIRLYWAWEVKE